MGAPYQEGKFEYFILDKSRNFYSSDRECCSHLKPSKSVQALPIELES